MTIKRVIPQLRTTDMDSSVRFYTEKLGFLVEFNYKDFYVEIRAGEQFFHIKLVDDADPSIPYVNDGDHFHLYFQTDDVAAYANELKSKGVDLLRDVYETPWETREFTIRDDQGHTLYFGEPL
jgi:catechol 2,3-dioxygenase-like lactoylglutathione lyase family enzyme